MDSLKDELLFSIPNFLEDNASLISASQTDL